MAGGDAGGNAAFRSVAAVLLLRGVCQRPLRTAPRRWRASTATMRGAGIGRAAAAAALEAARDEATAALEAAAAVAAEAEAAQWRAVRDSRFRCRLPWLKPGRRRRPRRRQAGRLRRRRCPQLLLLLLLLQARRSQRRNVKRLGDDRMDLDRKRHKQ